VYGIFVKTLQFLREITASDDSMMFSVQVLVSIALLSVYAYGCRFRFLLSSALKANKCLGMDTLIAENFISCGFEDSLVCKFWPINLCFAIVPMAGD